MKKTLVILFSIFFTIIFSSCNCDGTNSSNLNSMETDNQSIKIPSTSTNSNNDNDWKLIVYDNDISETITCEYVEEENFVKIPFIATLDAMGAKIQWETSEIVQIKFNQHSLTLNLKQITFCNNKTPNVNIFLEEYLPYWPYYFYIHDQELYIPEILFARIINRDEFQSTITMASPIKTLYIVKSNPDLYSSK